MIASGSNADGTLYVFMTEPLGDTVFYRRCTEGEWYPEDRVAIFAIANGNIIGLSCALDHEGTFRVWVEREDLALLTTAQLKGETEWSGKIEGASSIARLEDFAHL